MACAVHKQVSDVVQLEEEILRPKGATYEG